MTAALAPLLSRRSHRTGPALTLGPDIALAQGRVHEICGRARRSLALRLAAETEGPVVWIAPSWGTDPLGLDGVAALVAPARLVFLSPARTEDQLWCLEESLRSGMVPLVVADLSEPPALTPVRRLHLAAEAGTAEGGPPPTGLLLTPREGGAPGVETRFRIEPDHAPGETRWRLDRLRARMAPPRSWTLGPGMTVAPEHAPA
ncbi:ImuA family protein [Litorisediminicola beolgyonensis]|uniref:ImuA family protein n=1 Tax=Litorisediminicola beolgyonensis TaxID=1173614 RepID=A0ABW3ZNM1_9RHOB